jgi:soluble lytic murein transglycosylase
MTYWRWAQALPTYPDPEFIAFIEPNTPLTQKLRAKWLYQLAKSNDWVDFDHYYRETGDRDLRCYAQLALFHTNQPQAALTGAFRLWSDITTNSPACDALFTELLNHHAFNQAQIDQRVRLALQHNKLALALTLLRRSGAKRAYDLKLLIQVSKKPKSITLLHPGGLNSDIALYGLKLMVSRRNKAVVDLWHEMLNKNMLNIDQQQQFLAYQALYQAMRNQADAPQWLQQVKPEYTSDSLRDWEIRYALAHQQWKNVIQLTSLPQRQIEQSWQYWRARALDQLGRHQDAIQIYQNLALNRSYYGFLASMRIRQTPHFQEETIPLSGALLEPYKPIMTLLADLYTTQKQTLAATHLLNDFTLELSKPEKAALVYWIAEHLQWYSKAAHMSTQDETIYNQLSLRFPLAYSAFIKQFASEYQIEPALIFATIRQESIFSETIRSPAGACGLMQLLPQTAALIAKQEHIPFSRSEDLFSSEKNIHIGVAYLQQLKRQFKAHPLLMMAAYNAGPKQVNYWIKHLPRNDIDIWIETLPWQETRNYLKNIISFYVVYQHRMQQSPDLDVFLKPI